MSGRPLPRLFCLALALLLSAGAEAQQQVSHQELTHFVDQSGQLQVIKNAQHWAQRRAAILQGFEAAAGPLPDRTELPDLDLQITSDIPFHGTRRLSGTIQAEPGDRIPLDLYLPNGTLQQIDVTDLFDASKADAVPGILALHPTGLPGKRLIAGEKPNRQYALELAQRGYVVVAPDYMSFGDYQDYDFAADRYMSGTMKGIFNHMRCVDLLAELACVDNQRMAAIGHSLGGHNAIFVGVFDQRIKAIVSSCGWTPFHYYYGGDLTGWTSARYLPQIRDTYQLNADLVPFDFYELVAALAPRPFLSVSPAHDGNFDVVGVQQAMPKARKIYELLGAADEIVLQVPECGHDFPPDMREAAYQLIDRTLKFVPVSAAPTEAP